MSTITFARALFLTNLKSALALRGAFALQVGFMILNNLTFFVFWWVLFDRVPNLRGWEIEDVQLLFGISASGFGLVAGFFGGVRHLGRTIDEGDLDPLLSQPKSTLLYAVGMRSQASGFGDLLSGILFIGVSGALTWWSAPWLILGIASSAATFLGTGIVYFSFAFWLPRAESVSRQFWDLLITFSLYPEPLFGGALRLILYTLLPAGFISYLPVSIVREPSFWKLSLLLIGAVGYLWFAAWFFSRGCKRYSSGSRFGILG